MLQRAMEIKCALVLAVIPALIHAVSNVNLSMPVAVQKGHRAELFCTFDMEGETLYAVKWYKGRREFYRYSPKETPARKTFNTTGINVVESESNDNKLTLSNVTPYVNGKYTCEVSADAPSFHTVTASGDMEVVEFPIRPPHIQTNTKHHRVGETIRLNCTSNKSRPAANLTWTVNDHPVNPSNVRIYRPVRYNNSEYETSISHIHFLVTKDHFVKNKLKIGCTSRIHDLYKQYTEVKISQKMDHDPISITNSRSEWSDKNHKQQDGFHTHPEVGKMSSASTILSDFIYRTTFYALLLQKIIAFFLNS